MVPRAVRAARVLLVRTAAAPLLAVLRLVAARQRRRPAHDPPRVFRGMTPIVTLATLQRAARSRGLIAETVVREVYSIHQRGLFDRLAEDILPRPLKKLPQGLRVVVADVLVFLHALRHYDVFVFYVDGRILVRTPLRDHEYDLLHRAGKRVIVTCYGGDIQTLDRIVEPAFRERLVADYPNVVDRQDWVRRLRADAERGADVLVAGVEWVDYLQSWTHLVSAPYFLDPSDWPVTPVERSPGDELVVFHAANHPRIKGSELLAAAVDSLRERGVRIRLDAVSGVGNDEVRERMAAADIVADQFIIGWYGLQAVEAMSLGKPVIAYLRPDLLRLYSEQSYAADCPIVPTRADEIADVLARLAADAELRHELGLRGRDYVERFHSVAAAADMLQTWIAATEHGPAPRHVRVEGTDD